jgi:DNA-binding NtrC family response regulator
LGLFDGDISCRSVVGKGTVFEFLIPLSKVSNEALPLTHTEPLPDEATQFAFVNGKNFVVLEDDLLVADALSGVLRTMGGNVKIFRSAEEALTQGDAEPADFFIVDYMVDGALNGIQFLNEWRRKSDKPIKAVIVSGDTSTGFAREIEQSDWPFLYKPVNVAKLIGILASR